MRLFLAATIAAAIAGSTFPLTAARQKTAGGTEMPGRAVYEDACSRCHGLDGRGQRAPWLVPFGWNYSQALDIVRHGGPCGMPAFTESELSDEKLKQIVDYLRTLTEPIDQETTLPHDQEAHAGTGRDRCCSVAAVRSCE